MLIAVLLMTIMSWAALVTTLVTGNTGIGWMCACVAGIGLVLLVVDALRERAHRDPSSAAAVSPGQLHKHRHTADDELFGEHEVRRDIAREGWVVHSDTGPGEIDRSYEEAVESLDWVHQHQRPAHRHGPSPSLGAT